MEWADEDSGCEQCGLCCRVFGDKITPTVANIYSWMENGQHDILRFFQACLADGSWVRCDRLFPDDLSEVVLAEIRDPDTGGYLPVCPFLRRVGKHRYLCSIHDAKPEMCRNYEPWIWGETFFPKCRVLEKCGRDCRPGSDRAHEC